MVFYSFMQIVIHTFVLSFFDFRRLFSSLEVCIAWRLIRNESQQQRTYIKPFQLGCKLLSTKKYKYFTILVTCTIQSTSTILKLHRLVIVWKRSWVWYNIHDKRDVWFLIFFFLLIKQHQKIKTNPNTQKGWSQLIKTP